MYRNALGSHSSSKTNMQTHISLHNKKDLALSKACGANMIPVYFGGIVQSVAPRVMDCNMCPRCTCA